MLHLCLLLVWSALAQEPLLAGPTPVSIASGATWREDRGTSRMEERLFRLARAPDGGAWLLGLEDGSLWRSLDGARTWSRVLRAPSERVGVDDEQVLLDGEVALEEELERTREDTTAEEQQRVELEAEATGEDVGASDPDGAIPEEAAQRSADIDRAVMDPVLDADDEDRPAVVWFDPADGQVALAGRGDGIWRSVDGGVHWRRTDRAADAWRFLSVPSLDIVMAGTTTGVRVSPDGGERWFDTVDVTDGLQVDALVEFQGQVLAGTRAGLFSSRDGLRWARLPLSGVVTALLPDPGWVGGLWVGTPSGLLRSDDAGKSFYRAGRQVLAGLRGLAQLEGQGHIAAWGHDGVWESMDGGVTWHPVFAGLQDPDIRDLVVVGNQAVAAGSGSIWRLGAERDAAAYARTGVVTVEDQALLGFLVDVSTRRQGLDLAVLQVGAIAERALLPTLTVDVQIDSDRGRSSAPLSAQTVENGDGAVYFGTSACFGACAALTAGTANFDDAYAVQDGATLDELYTVDGRLVGGGSEAFVATAAAQGMRKYRQLVADQVAGAWSTIQRLDAGETPPSLAGQVTRALDLQEAAARLDLYTDGAYARSRNSESVP
ncbi:MAG: hypothetical protein EXR71_20060 [Myxococcales bacterium]|nr:hypothetical protein [Myxococcales bacterium]